MTEPKPRARRLVNDPCPIDQATLERGVAAIERLAEAADDLKEAAAAVVYLREAEEKLCSWFKTKGPWVIAGIAFLWSSLGKVSPELADAALKLLLAQAGA